MQMIFLSQSVTIALCFVLWAVYQLTAAWISLKLPDWVFDSNRFIFQTRTWEKDGLFYRRWFRVHRWKQYLPDGGAVRGKTHRKKRLDQLSKTRLDWFLRESCRAELTHLLAIFPFWTFGFLASPEIIGYMLAYGLAVNVPCILVQRYNRPRVRALLEKRYERK